MAQVMNYTNFNQGLMDEHRRSVTVENELNNRINSILTGTTQEGLDTLAEIVSIFQNGDLTLSRNLQVFSSKYNALVNDFNTLSQSHQDLLHKVNSSLISVNPTPLAYSSVTQDSITFNVNSGVVNVSLTIGNHSGDTNVWDQRNTTASISVWQARSIFEDQVLKLPYQDNIQGGVSIIVKRSDKRDSSGNLLPNHKKFEAEYANDSASLATVKFHNNGDELILLGMPGVPGESYPYWYTLKAPPIPSPIAVLMTNLVIDFTQTQSNGWNNDTLYGPSNALTDDYAESSDNTGWVTNPPEGFVWIAQTKTNPTSFVVDLGRNAMIHSFKIRNAHQSNGNHLRFTKDYTVSIQVNGTWKDVANGTLPNDVSLLIDTLSTDQSTPTRYVRFQAVTGAYPDDDPDGGSALHYFGVLEAVPVD